MEEMLETRLVTCEGAALLAVSGEIDMSVADRLSVALDAALDAAQRSVQVDLRGVSYLDSCGCHSLVRVATEAHARGLDFEVVSASAHAQRVLGLLGLLDALRVPSSPAV
jgi:anti-anti-sigma factor